MTHADSLSIPSSIAAHKLTFYAHLLQQLLALVAVDAVILASNWISLLSNTCALLYGSFENCDAYFGTEEGRRINWLGFYLIPALYPPFISSNDSSNGASSVSPPPLHLLLGPFAGRPACQYVPLATRSMGVCASSFLACAAVVVDNVEEREGHIACDGKTKSEIVLPLIATRRRAAGSAEGEAIGDPVVVGVLDVDCERVGAFDEQDRIGLERIVQHLVEMIDWGL